MDRRRRRLSVFALALLPLVLLLAVLVAVRLRLYGPLRWVRRFNKRLTNQITRRIAGRPGSPFALIRHRGRRSGRVYETPVNVFAAGSSFFIGLTYGPGTDWCRNVRAAGGATLLYHGVAYQVHTPEVASAAVVLPALPPPIRLAGRLLGIHEFLQVMVDRDAPIAAHGEPAEP